MLFVSTMDYKYVYYHMEVANKDQPDLALLSEQEKEDSLKA